MMKKEPIEQLFNRLSGEFDTASPSADHKALFRAKLESQQIPLAPRQKQSHSRWIRPLLIAASLVFIAGLLLSQLATPTQSRELADVSPEMQETQDFFTKTIERELFDIRENITPENEKIVLDAIKQLEILEKDYDKLKADLSESGEDKRVIYAMIDNFQNRIDLLQSLVEQMNAIRNLNTIQEVQTL